MSEELNKEIEQKWQEKVARLRKKYHTEEIITARKSLSQAKERREEARDEVDRIKHLRHRANGYGVNGLITHKINVTLPVAQDDVESAEEAVQTAEARLKAVMRNAPRGCRYGRHSYVRTVTRGYDGYDGPEGYDECRWCGHKSYWYKEHESSMCAIATATYGTPLDPRIGTLKDYRDRYLSERLARFYYAHSPPVAELIQRSWLLKQASLAALTPLVILTKRITDHRPIIGGRLDRREMA